MGPSEMDTNFMLLRRELKKSKCLSSLQIVDKIESIVTDVVVHSCPICGELLEKRCDDKWVCRGQFHGEGIVFIEGIRGCPYCKNGGPYCEYTGYCLSQKFVEYGKPKMCLVGRIDDQSPK